MTRFGKGLGVVALFALIGCAGAEEPGEPWDGIEDGASSPAEAPDDEAEADDDSGPHRASQPRIEPLEDEPSDDDPEPPDVDDEPIDDLECDADELIAAKAGDCREDQVFAGGCCWDDLQIACDALACDTDCLGITTVPLTAACVPG